MLPNVRKRRVVLFIVSALVLFAVEMYYSIPISLIVFVTISVTVLYLLEIFTSITVLGVVVETEVKSEHSNEYVCFICDEYDLSGHSIVKRKNLILFDRTIMCISTDERAFCPEHYNTNVDIDRQFNDSLNRPIQERKL